MPKTMKCPKCEAILVLRTGKNTACTNCGWQNGKRTPK